jgi:hypothetical protein
MFKAKLVFIATAIALMIPAMAFANNGKGQGQGQGPNYETAPPSHAKAYGKYCQGESKKHVKGEKGTEFSRCVTAVAKLRHDERQKEREEKEQEQQV